MFLFCMMITLMLSRPVTPARSPPSTCFIVQWVYERRLREANRCVTDTRFFSEQDSVYDIILLFSTFAMEVVKKAPFEFANLWTDLY